MIFLDFLMSAFATVIRDLIGRWTFYTRFFKLFHVSAVVANFGSLKYHLQFLNKCFYHKLAKFEQNRITRTALTLELFDKKSFTMLIISKISLAPS